MTNQEKLEFIDKKLLAVESGYVSSGVMYLELYQEIFDNLGIDRKLTADDSPSNAVAMIQIKALQIQRQL